MESLLTLLHELLHTTINIIVLDNYIFTLLLFTPFIWGESRAPFLVLSLTTASLIPPGGGFSAFGEETVDVCSNDIIHEYKWTVTITMAIAIYLHIV